MDPTKPPHATPETRTGTTASVTPPRSRVWRRAIRWIEHLCTVGAAVVALFILTPISTRIYAWFDCQDELKPARYIICLGGHSNRIIESARLLSEGWADRMIVSNHGANSNAMREVAIEWGADPRKIIVDDKSWTTRDHPAAVRDAAGIDPARDVCIVVTSYTHMRRAKACFERAGYRHIVLREPRWERRFRAPEESTWKARFMILPQMVYEGAAWLEYKLRGAI